jgi:hypothetical protein
MTCRSDRVAAHRPAWGALVAALVLVALAGCGDTRTADRAGPRQAASALMARLASVDVAGVCGVLSAHARAELAVDFGGSSCPQTAAATVRYVRDRTGMQRAVRGVRIYPTLDVPLSPAPQRAGAATVPLRLVYDDPALHSTQAFDILVRRIGGRWRVDSGISALFTIVHD